MSDLVNAAVNVKTPLTLFALLALIVLIAFRTRRVPELFFKLAASKLTRERFAQLLRRFMAYGFAAFVVVCASAVAAQLLAFYSRPRVASLDAFKSEVDRLGVANDAAAKALADYRNALASIDAKRLTEAMSYLESSIKQVPTVSARLTAAYLFDRMGQKEAARAAAKEAEALARARTSPHEANVIGASPVPATGLIGDKLPLPSGGDSLESATPIQPGLYLGMRSSDRWKFFRIDVSKGQTLTVTFRSDDSGNPVNLRIHGSDGEDVGSETSYGYQSRKGTLTTQATEAGALFMSMSGGIQGTVVRVSVR